MLFYFVDPYFPVPRKMINGSVVLPAGVIQARSIFVKEKELVIVCGGLQ